MLRIANPRKFARFIGIVAALSGIAVWGFHPPAAVAEAPPTRLVIKSLGIDAKVLPYTEAEAALRKDGATGAPCLVDGVIRCINPVSKDDVSWQVAGVGGLQLGATPATDAAGTVYLYGHAAEGGTAIFDHLNSLQVGDKATLTTEAGVLKYEVTEVLSVSKEEFVWLPEVIDQVPGRLLLVSCDHTESSEFVNGGFSTRNVIAVLQLKTWHRV